MPDERHPGNVTQLLPELVVLRRHEEPAGQGEWEPRLDKHLQESLRCAFFRWPCQPAPGCTGTHQWDHHARISPCSTLIWQVRYSYSYHWTKVQKPERISRPPLPRRPFAMMAAPRARSPNDRSSARMQPWPTAGRGNGGLEIKNGGRLPTPEQTPGPNTSRPRQPPEKAAFHLVLARRVTIQCPETGQGGRANTSAKAPNLSSIPAAGRCTGGNRRTPSSRVLGTSSLWSWASFVPRASWAAAPPALSPHCINLTESL